MLTCCTFKFMDLTHNIFSALYISWESSLVLMYLKHYSCILKICSILLSPELEEGMEILSWDMDVF